MASQEQTTQKMPPERKITLPGWFWVGAFLVFISVLVPVGFATLAYFKDTDLPRLMLEFLLGTWPNQLYDDPTSAEFADDFALIIGVGMRAFIIFGIPAILGVTIYLLQKRLEERMKEMRFDNYMANYRMFLGTEMVRTLKLWVDDLGLDPETVERLVKERAEGAELGESLSKLIAWLGEMHDPETVIQRVDMALQRADEAWNEGHKSPTIEFKNYVDIPAE